MLIGSEAVFVNIDYFVKWLVFRQMDDKAIGIPFVKKIGKVKINIYFFKGKKTREISYHIGTLLHVSLA